MTARRYAVLLRGINVGGNNKLPMAELRPMLEGRGYERVATYIQSGNVVLDAPVEGDAALAADITAAIAERFGLDIAVVVRTHAELVQIVDDNPFADHLDEKNKLMVGFAMQPLPAEQVTARPGSVDQFVIRRREVFLYCPDGIGRSKLPDFDRQTKVAVTVRNWNTVLKLVSMTEP